MSVGCITCCLSGEIPTEAEALEIEEEWKNRGEVPEYVFDLIRAMPYDTHPMTLFSMAVLSMQPDSLFARKYHEDLKKESYWEPMLGDSLNLTAKLPEIAAFIYRLKYKDGQRISPDPNLDWGANFAHMMGIPDPEYQDLSRLYFLLHSDHESGNASAHATHLAASDSLGYLLRHLGRSECPGWAITWARKPGMLGVAVGCFSRLRLYR